MNVTNNASKPIAPQSKGQSSSIDAEIKELQRQKQKLQNDMQKKSTNPDPKAAKAENDANRDANQKLIQDLDRKIKELQVQKSAAPASTGVAQEVLKAVDKGAVQEARARFDEYTKGFKCSK